ncbi:hypothetical protein G9C98_000961, partial [Cotesia typhae]
VLQKDIETHGRIVNSIVKLGERVFKQQCIFKNDSDNNEEKSENQQNRPSQAIRVARSLERRWHLLFLRALEWQCHIETLATRLCNRNIIQNRCVSDSDDEPVTKQPRLSRRQLREPRKETRGHSGWSRQSSFAKRLLSPKRLSHGIISSCSSDTDMSSGTQNNDEESYFEDDLEELCGTEEKQKNFKRSETIPDFSSSDQGTEGDIEEGEVSDDEMAPTLNPAMIDVSEVDGPSHDLVKNPTILQDLAKRRKIFDESSSFNTSDRKSKNCATFYFKHRDTDSEVDRTYDNDFEQNDSSEGEWTYTASPIKTSAIEQSVYQANEVVCSNFEGPAIEQVEHVEYENHPKTTIENKKIDSCDSDDETKKDIRKLILEVEKLVSEEGQKEISKNLPPLIFDKYSQNNYRTKYARIKEWLRVNSHHDTEEISSLQVKFLIFFSFRESDVEKQSDSSDDLQSSVVTYRQYEKLDCTELSISQEIFNDTDQTLVNEISNPIGPEEVSTPKVMMRSKAKSNGPRPWSVSCVFDQLNSTNDSTISQFSISETALHQLVASPPTKSASLDASDSHKVFKNSTSTLLEESSRSIRNSLSRKKKSKLRKKNLSRRSESSSDGVNSGASDSSGTHHNRSVQKVTEERTRFKKPDCHRCLVSLLTHGSTLSCHLHNDGNNVKSFVGYPSPSIELTCCTPDPSSGGTEDICLTDHGTSLNILMNRHEVNSPINGDSDAEKNSLGNNSFSEQAWDSYQEKYMSEPYSETADVETARKLLDFGDDYRNYLDSQSDCASSLSAVRSYSPPLITNRIYSNISTISSNDSDSDSEGCRHVLEKSYRKLMIEFENVCKDNINYLQSFIEANCSMSEKSLKQVSGLAEKWKYLSYKAEEAQRSSTLQREMATMHLELRAVHERFISHEIILEPAYLIEDNINQITTELATLREHKKTMLALNVSTHRLITEMGAAATSVSISLKDAVADLYRIWDETFQRGNQKLSTLQAIQQFTTRLTELQNALRRDKDTLAVLDAALQAGAISEVASSVRDVARLLSEKQSTNQNKVIKEDVLTLVSSENFVESGLFNLGQEAGSFSDSGISDSGSEQELNERERRLAALRRLTRSLESQLAPGNEALTELLSRVGNAEAELRNLQKECRELIVRTAASVKAKVTTRSQAKYLSNKRKKRFIDSEASRKFMAAADPDEEPSTSQSWVWRVLKAALPLQLALIALFCAACFLEPHCCEASNNVNFIFTPQLRYIRGPPPI